MQLTRLLREDDTHRIFLGALDKNGVLRPEADALGVGEIAEFPLTSFYDRNFVAQTRRFAEFVKQNDIHIVHTHDFYTNVFGMTGARIAKVPARIASKRETAMRSIPQAAVERIAFAFADKITVNAVAVRDFLMRRSIDPDKIRTIYNGLDLQRLQPRTASRVKISLELQLPIDKKFVTIVANLRHKVKNLPMFLRAAQIVKKRFADAAFVVAGEGDLLPDLQRLARELQIEKDVFFIGRCTQVAELLLASDVCALSSTAEGFSNSILEYMAAQRPVVATQVGGAAEAIENERSGFLVKSNDHEAMAQKILLLLENPRIAVAFGERGREIVTAKFSLETQLSHTLELYAEAMR